MSYGCGSECQTILLHKLLYQTKSLSSFLANNLLDYPNTIGKTSTCMQRIFHHLHLRTRTILNIYDSFILHASYHDDFVSIRYDLRMASAVKSIKNWLVQTLLKYTTFDKLQLVKFARIAQFCRLKIPYRSSVFAIKLTAQF